MQLKGLVQKNAPVEPKKEVQEVALPFYTQKWLDAGLTLKKNVQGFYFQKEIFYELDHIHGKVELSKLDAAISYMQTNFPNHPLTIQPNMPFCFYDTETTGLKGAGVLIFLNGIIKKVEDGYLLTQYILADPGQEAAFLYASDFWRHEQSIITYNGKSFDFPQLVTRWTMNRNALPELKELSHVDLMHSSKRVWKDDLERFKLKQVEEIKLGFTRENDIPGHLAPVIYFDAVRNGDPSNLLKVLLHNEWDILSLVALYILTVDLIREKEVNESATTYTNIGKWFRDLKVHEESQDWFQFVVEQYEEEEAGTAYYFVGLHLKKQKRYIESIEAFHTAVPQLSGKYKIESFIELAKLYEHRMKDFELALDVTNKCISYLREINIDKESKLWQATLKRKIRIIRKWNISRESAQHNKKRV